MFSERSQGIFGIYECIFQNHLLPPHTHTYVLMQAFFLCLFVFSFLFACKYCKYGDRVRKIILQYMKFDQ